jgi:hypothetical protein
LDTGVSYALVPKKDFEKITEVFSLFGVTCTEPKKSTFVSTHKCKCSNFDSLPSIQMTLLDQKFKSKIFKLPKESYMQKVG